ncbi:xanthine dehydrogenase family protein molybdopterin-binding subunit [Shewanella benthica]|nr:xanthine dehydrogenase family protein molybdopterin-binding subunit [Shewanella benthica]
MNRDKTQFKWQEATGDAKFIADRHFDNLLEGRLFRSSCPRGKIESIKLPDLPEGYFVFGAKDVPGRNVLQMVEADWPVFADDEVRYLGQIILLVVGPEIKVLEQILDTIHVEYQPLTPAFTLPDSQNLIDGAIHGQDNKFDSHSINRGDVNSGFAQAEHIFEETLSTSYQEHMYLEPQGMVGYPQDGKIVIEGSMQCPWYVHHCISVVLGHNKVRVIQATTGGGFGGKEDYPDVLAGALCVAVERVGQPIRLILPRSEDIAFTSKRHPIDFHYRTGVDKQGKIVAMEVKIDINSGAYLSLSGIVLQRAITSCINVYEIDNVRVDATAWATNTSPNGAFRGFGSPQTCFGIETHLSHVAKHLGLEPADFKHDHLLNTDSTTLTGASIFGDLVLEQMYEQICEASDYHKKAKAYRQQSNKSDKLKGIGLAMFQHGCGFAGDLEDTLVKAKVRLVKGADNEVEIQVSNTDLGQGLSLTFCQIVADALKVPLTSVRLARADTGVVPDSGPTVASRSIVIVGYLIEVAAKKLADIWIKGTEQCVEEDYKKPSYHKWDQEKFEGNAYQVTSYGMNVVEIELDPATGETEITGLWAVYDVGHAIDEMVFKGQIDGGFVQALGYGSLERMTLDSEGKFQQTTMADYVIPTSMDVPAISSALVDNPYKYGPKGAKGGGELTHNGGAAAYCAAVESAIGLPISSIPITPEVVCDLLYGAKKQCLGNMTVTSGKTQGVAR